MERQPRGGPSSTARKRPWDWDQDTTRSDPSETEDSADGAGSGRSPPLECLSSAQDTDSDSSTEDPVPPRRSRGKTEEHAGPVSLSTMESLKGHFTGAVLDFRRPCTAAEDTTCQIVGHLSAWNEFLCLASLQLREMPGSGGGLSLVFFQDPTRSDWSLQGLRLVTLLVCHLLKSHRCVAHVELDVRLFKVHRELLSDALRESPSITSVKLTLSCWVSGEDLATATLSPPHLQKLEWAGYAQYSMTLVAGLSTLLQTTRSLTTLQMSEEYPAGLSSEDFFRGLTQNRSLTELVLPRSLVAEAPPTAQAAFAEWLENSVSLKRLTVGLSYRACMSLKCILQALLKNRSIVAVEFKCPEVDERDPRLLSQIFEQNKVLQIFKISYGCRYPSMSSLVEGRPSKADCDRCLKALIKNHSLQEVTLPIDVWDEDQWRELFEALPTKENLKRVNIDVLGRAHGYFVAKFCAVLKETGAEDKVSFNTFLSEWEFDERFECKAFSSLVVQVSDDSMATVHEILERMPSLGHITDFSLHFDMLWSQVGVLPSSMATFLAETHTLGTLCLRTSSDDWLDDWQEAVMEGLAANASLREVKINALGTRNDFSLFSEALADVISASRNITRVRFRVGRRNCAEQAFFQRLSAGIADNYTLLGVTTLGYMYSKLKRSWFEVWEVTNRNNDLLTRAADFARGARHDRRCALALERMQGHPELGEQVARLEEVDQARAATMVQQGLRSIQWADMHHFMRLAGVVRERVSCRASKDGRTQLDALNDHCWRAIRCYLKLRDIRDPTAASLPPQ